MPKPAILGANGEQPQLSVGVDGRISCQIEGSGQLNMMYKRAGEKNR